MPRSARRWAIVGLAVAAAAGIGIGVAVGTSARGASPLPLAPLSRLSHLQPAPSPGPTGPEGVPVPNAPSLAPAGAIEPGASVDGIRCEPTEQVLFHVHVHLTVFVDGAARRVPYGIGVAPPREVERTPAGPFVGGGSCFAWLHTHAADGIVHIESPVRRTYTLGDFFDVWGQPLGADRVGPARGRVNAIYDGRVFEGNPRRIPLRAHAQIQLEVGAPLVAPERITFPDGL